MLEQSSILSPHPPGLGSSSDLGGQRRDSLTGSDYKRQSMSMNQFYSSSPQLGPIGMPSAGSLSPPPSQSTLSGLGLGKYLDWMIEWNFFSLYYISPKISLVCYCCGHTKTCLLDYLAVQFFYDAVQSTAFFCLFSHIFLLHSLVS